MTVPTRRLTKSRVVGSQPKGTQRDQMPYGIFQRLARLATNLVE